MTWTTEVPTVEGYYWFRETDEPAFPVEVSLDRWGKAYAWWFGTDDCQAIVSEKWPNRWKGEWYGPIQPPE